ncbi:MAG: hypothetical protein ACXWP4_19860, partial [Polyangiales bacterium]
MKRRTILAAMVAVLLGMAARKAHALRDPSELSVGGSTGAHDAHISCGPDVRVRHASGGMQYQRVFQAEGRKEGVGLSMDIRAGAGNTVITKVTAGDEGSTSETQKLGENELDRVHWLGSVQGSVGYDWRTFALRGGLGYFGFSSSTDDHVGFVAKYYPLPTLDMRIGQRTGIRGELGVGAPPIPGLARWYSLYGLLNYRFKEGGEVGAGHVIAFGGTFDQRMGFVFKGAIPITQKLWIGGFGMI